MPGEENTNPPVDQELPQGEAIAPEAIDKTAPEEPKVAPIAALDGNLMRDVLGQMRDLHKTLTATLEQNIVDEQRGHIADAANVLTSAAESISKALNVEVA